MAPGPPHDQDISMRRTLTALALTFLSATSSLAAESCTKILSDLSFCPTKPWAEIDEQLPYGIAAWTNENMTAKLIAQQVSPGVDATPEVVLDQIKASVRNSLSNPEDVTFVQHQVAEGAIIDHGILSYDLSIRNQTVRVYHSFMLTDAAVVQFVSHTRGADIDENLASHLDFVSSFQLIEPQIDA
jgi:hypothetical protein